MEFRHATVVYQEDLANVVGHCGAECRLLLKANYHDAETFAAGLKAAGVIVKSKWTDLPGDILHEIWHKDLTQSPHFSKYKPVV
jgi:hypothetical protein